MQPVDSTARRYDGTTMAFHWLTAILVVTQWVGAQVIDYFPPGPLRVDARSVHIVGGAVLAAILAGRIVWRLTGGRRLPLADRGVVNVLAKGTHWLLYVLLLAMVGVGLWLEWARGDVIFNLFKIPAYSAAVHGTAHQIQDVHATIGWLILALAGLHAGAALVHRYLWNDGVLARMLPGR